MKPLLLLSIAFFSGILAHPFSTFVLTLYDSNGVENPFFQANTPQTIYFRFRDLKNSLANVSQNQLQLHHARWVHIQFCSYDQQWLWHVHPDDFYDVSQMGSNGMFWVQVTFPQAGYYSMAADFIFVGPTGRREGVATNYVQVENGTPMPPLNQTTRNFSNTTYIASWDFGENERFLGPIVSSTNIVGSNVGIKVVLEILQNVSGDMSGMTGMHMRTTPSTSGNTAIVGKCAFFKISVYWNDGTPVTTLRPYLNAAVHFTMMAGDGGLYHAHGSYLPDGMSPADVSAMMMMMEGGNHNMTDEMMNLTMNAMMSGLFENGTLNCLSDAGVVMDDMDRSGMIMDHNSFYGPPSFGSSVFGLFDWNTYGTWRMWAWMTININGTNKLLVPQFDVQAIWDPNMHTTMDMSMSMDMGTAVSIYPLTVLVALIVLML